MNQKIRSEALENMYKQDDIHSILFLVKGSSWILIISFFLIIVSILYWLFFVELKEKYEAHGMLLMEYSGINSPSDGMIAAIKVKKNEKINTQNEIATIIKDIEIIAQLKNKINDLNRYKSIREEMISYLSESFQKKSKLLDNIAGNIKNTLNDIKEIENLNLENVILAKEDFKNREITSSFLLDRMQIYKNSLLKRKETENNADINKIDKDLEDLKFKKEVNKVEIFLSEQAIELRALRQRAYQKIISHLKGKIIELNAVEGMWVKKGSRLATIETGNELKFICYIPHHSGRSVTVNNKVYISPSNVKVEEHGYLTGYVTKVYSMPVSDENMKNDLPNVETINQFKKVFNNRALTKIVVALDKIEDGKLKWTSSKEPDFEIDTGTICSAFIDVDTFYPYERILKWLHKFFQVP